MQYNHLTEEEIAYTLEHAEPINNQLNKIEQAANGSTHQASLIAELCMFHFSLGRAFEKIRNS